MIISHIKKANYVNCKFTCILICDNIIFVDIHLCFESKYYYKSDTIIIANIVYKCIMFIYIYIYIYILEMNR